MAVLSYTPKNKIFVGDSMTFRYEFRDARGNVLDMSLSSVKQFKFKGPGSVSFTVGANFTTDGTDGFLQYTTDTVQLSVAGEWKVQAYFEGVDTFKGHSTIDIFSVFDNL